MPEEQIDEILALVARRRGIDFRDYRRDTVCRRAELRVRATGCADLAAYCRYLSNSGDEVDRLVETLVVPVTEFFRDAWAFQELADRVLPELLARKPLVRAWVAGAATGEEAYTLAILLAEASARIRGNDFEVIASDLDQGSLEKARRGIYPAAVAMNVPADLLGRHLRYEAGSVRVLESLRNRVRFAQHDLTGTLLAPREAVVAAFDLVLCRNVLLYFTEPLRTTVASRLAGVLEPGGALMIGAFESLPEGLSGRLDAYPGIKSGAGIFRRSTA